MAGGLREALGGWLKAQGLLMLITFGELAAGFLLLRVELSLLLAGLVALVDALPVFGTGTVLLPWAVLALLGGDVRMSVGLLVLYSVISLVRSLLEPRLVGGAGGAPSPGCPGLHVCGLSGARSSWNASRPTGRRAGPAALGFRPPAQPVRTLSKQPAAHAAGCLFLYFVPSAGI